MSKTKSPFAIVLRDGETVDHLDYQNAEEHVRLYGATWADYDAAITTVSANREEHRKQRTVDAKAQD
ncbi:hypothetical protein EN814_09755 [Mesorhizobium sp. M2D.F.Ca.ET.171.01.1.1]|uniref:hypothetical protein n=1 Tax=unclassified Mesorhizobium TaxID=325217 RepID=UPI001091A1C8|nr:MULTISPECIES: hypothetical protein [unclassified Mesorhizobium]TGS97468.1 hypothetical protein EN821_09750 [Mesorhizobium sp. M2D.F.Ca.ET.178.01.1.1]TGT12039.1 hypothetical protein EN814_09755 [Mesorhizobium sp. M2D.F.Ca.ET.171.01.1.1]